MLFPIDIFMNMRKYSGNIGRKFKLANLSSLRVKVSRFYIQLFTTYCWHTCFFSALDRVDSLHSSWRLSVQILLMMKVFSSPGTVKWVESRGKGREKLFALPLLFPNMHHRLLYLVHKFSLIFMKALFCSIFYGLNFPCKEELCSLWELWRWCSWRAYIRSRNKISFKTRFASGPLRYWN